MSSTATERHPSPPQLPPISMFTSRPASSSIMPASPPPSNAGYDNKQLKSLPILPKPSDFYPQQQQKVSVPDRPELLSPPQQSYYNHHNSTNTTTSSTGSYPSSTPHTPTNATTPDQSTLWALFNQFQQQQQQQQKGNHLDQKQQQQQQGGDAFRRASDPSDSRALSSEEVLAEKRRRNAGASARFRDRRKQRERELQDKCHELEQRAKELENALRRSEPDHPLLSKQPQHQANSDYNSANRSMTSSPPPSSQQQDDSHTLFDRVGQLEHLMTRFRQEKETDTQKLDELEKENKYLKSLLIPVSLPRQQQHTNKRMRLSGGSGSSSSSHSRESSDNDHH